MVSREGVWSRHSAGASRAELGRWPTFRYRRDAAQCSANRSITPASDTAKFPSGSIRTANPDRATDNAPLCDGTGEPRRRPGSRNPSVDDRLRGLAPQTGPRETANRSVADRTSLRTASSPQRRRLGGVGPRRPDHGGVRDRSAAARGAFGAGRNGIGRAVRHPCRVFRGPRPYGSGPRIRGTGAAARPPFGTTAWVPADDRHRTRRVANLRKREVGFKRRDVSWRLRAPRKTGGAGAGRAGSPQHFPTFAWSTWSKRVDIVMRSGSETGRYDRRV